MGAKQLSYSDEARQKLLAGVSKLARAVRSTLGPRGRNAVIDKGWGSPNVTKDGVQFSNGDGFTAERPALVTGTSSAACQGGNLFYASSFGCFNVNPAPGTSTISRNFGRGPASVTLNLRIAKTWAFGNKEQAAGPSGAFGGGMPPPGHAVLPLIVLLVIVILALPSRPSL
jgi:hypothetical protein